MYDYVNNLLLVQFDDIKIPFPSLFQTIAQKKTALYVKMASVWIRSVIVTTDLEAVTAKFQVCVIINY